MTLAGLIDFHAALENFLSTEIDQTTCDAGVELSSHVERAIFEAAVESATDIAAKLRFVANLVECPGGGRCREAETLQDVANQLRQFRRVQYQTHAA